MNESIVTYAPIVASFAAIAWTAYTYFSGGTKRKADEANVIIDIMRDIEDLRQRLSEKDRQIAALTAELDDLMKRFRVLELENEMLKAENHRLRNGEI